MTKVTTYSTNPKVDEVRAMAAQVANRIHWGTLDLPLGSGVILDIAVDAAYRAVELACDVADEVLGFEVEERFV